VTTDKSARRHVAEGLNIHYNWFTLNLPNLKTYQRVNAKFIQTCCTSPYPNVLHTDRQTDRQTNRQTDRQTDGQTDLSSDSAVPFVWTSLSPEVKHW